jgi:KEOPS complex subunit Pcc1
MHTAEIQIEHPKAEIIESTIRPESKEEFPRTSITVSRQDDKVTITIRSNDTNGLRAAINSYLRWMDMAIKIVDRIGD